MNSKITAIMLTVTFSVSFNVFAGDHDNFDKRISAIYGKKDFAEDAAKDSVSIDITTLSFYYYLEPIKASEYPIDERDFTSHASSVNVSVTHSSGDLSTAGTKTLNIKGDTYSGSFLWDVPDSPIFAGIGIDLEKAQLTAAAGPGDLTNKSTNINLGVGAYTDKTAAVTAILTTGKEKVSASAAPSTAVNDNKVTGYEVNYKHLMMLPNNKTFVFKIAYSTKTSKGEDGFGSKKDDTSKDINVDLSYYLDKETGIGFMYGKTTNTDNINGGDSFGSETTYSLGFSKHLDPNFNIIGIISKGKGGNSSTGDSTLYVLQLGYLF